MATEHEFPLPGRTTALTGDYFRTLAYSHPEAGENYSVFQEAVEHPLTNLWQIQEVWLRPNTVVANTDLKTLMEVKPLASGKAMSLQDALAHLGTFEIGNRQMGLQPTGETAAELGDTHVVKFAAMNGYAFDVTNNVHVTSRGRIVTKGYFSPEMRRMVLEQFGKAAAGRPKTAETGLSHLFTSKVEVEDFKRLIARKEALGQWNEFVKAVRSLVQAAGNAQTEGFSEIRKSRYLGVRTIHTYEEEDALLNAKKKVQEMLKDIPYISAEDKQRYMTAFEEIHFATELAYAKVLYGRLESSSDEAKRAVSQKNFDAQMDEVMQRLVKLGGTDRDKKRVNAEILGEKKVALEHIEKKCKALGIPEFGFVERFSRSKIEYFPDSILEFVASLGDVTIQLEQAVANEKSHITESPSVQNEEAEKRQYKDKRVTPRPFGS